MSDLVVRAHLARVLRAVSRRQAGRVSVSVEDTELQAVRIEVSASYGTDLAVLADHVRTQALAVIRDVVGDATDVTSTSRSPTCIADTDSHRPVLGNFVSEHLYAEVHARKGATRDLVPDHRRRNRRLGHSLRAVDKAASLAAESGGV